MKMSKTVEIEMKSCSEFKRAIYIEMKNNVSRYGYVDDWDKDQITIKDFQSNKHIIALEHVIMISDFVKRKGKDSQ